MRIPRHPLFFALTPALTLALAACSEAPEEAASGATAGSGITAAAPDPMGPRADDGSLGALTQERAAYRAARVSELRYDLLLHLGEPEAFGGAVTLIFELNGAVDALTLDFQDGEVLALTVNGTEVLEEAIDYNDHFLTLPSALLAEGANTVEIAFRGPWSNDGRGLYRFEDPEDGRAYTYTDLQPYEAHRIFPMFDQPDMKAHFKLKVTAPDDWQVIANTREQTVDTVGVTAEWTFPASELMPTYLFHVSAGPYAVFEDADFRYPLRLFVRESLAEYLDAELWFEIARAQFDFFDEYTEFPYPYGKYDQIIVPDYNAGAMENIAAVTWNESFVERDGRDPEETVYLAMVSGHEMAHMWYGDLVTPVWWDNLWLNESFAEWAGFHAAEAIGYDGAWEQFYSDWKTSAYRSDQRVTTHAVQTPVASTDNVLDNFDSLTYAKGGAILRQLEFLVGAETFRRALALHVSRHAHGNATDADLIASLVEAAGPDFEVDLEAWARDWIHTPSLNTLAAEFRCDDGRVSSMAIVQTAPEDYDLLRTQRVQVGLYRRDGESVVTDAVIPVLIEGVRTEVTQAVGEACPDLVYPNHGDLGYALIALDDTTRANLAGSIADLEDPFQRLMFWVTLYDQVRSGTLAATDYLDIALEGAAHESERTVVYELYSNLGVVTGWLEQMGQPGSQALAEYAPQVETMMWRRVMDADADIQSLFYDRYRAAVSTPDGLANLASVLDGRVDRLELDQDRRWQTLGVLADYGWGDAAQRIEAEAARDGSRRGLLSALALTASLPDAAQQGEMLAIVLDPETERNWSDVATMAGSLFPSGQEAMHAAVAEDIVAQLETWEAAADPDTLRVSRLVAGTLMPTFCTEESVARMAEIRAAHEDSRSGTYRAVTQAWENDARCLARLRAQAAAG